MTLRKSNNRNQSDNNKNYLETELSELLAKTAIEQATPDGNWDALCPEQKLMLMEQFPHLTDYFELPTSSTFLIKRKPKPIIHPFKELP